MKLIQRVAYYGAGFVVGLIILFFFLGGKKTSCDYGFDSRTLKNIRTKEMVFTEASEKSMQMLQIDTTAINYILKKGDVDFSETDRSLDSCKIYLVHGTAQEKEIEIRIKNCDTKAHVLAVEGK
ncbi:hypothetical protein G5B37_01790 [Rasiella rasia]|uniref:DUF4258 domain-containing protein n=1 Tax=Rasiella rasia TaxID=2744027 RepID=A0A6G6GII8_9FLAO|nr:hypothetical protein [Rasiella rasia]QIE58337.1 hypothetical protein G5B37_01790 [Rasiella rasia]